MELAVNNQVTIIENSIEVFKTAPAVLVAHQTRASKALQIADDILEQWKNAFAIADPADRIVALAEADARSMKYLAKCTGAAEEMKESRKAITQLMDMLKKMYTVEENSLDPKTGEKPAAIQKNRNQYATEVIKEQERQKKLAEAKAAKEKEANEIRAFISGTITRKLYEFLAQRKTFYTESFNTLSLADFEERSLKLRNMSTACPENKIAEVIRYDMPHAYRHDETELNMIRIKEHEAFDFPAFYSKYNTEISELKQSLVDRLPSKLTELKEAKRKADEAEKERLAELERQKQAQIQRDKDIAAANAKQKAKLEEENRLAQEREQQRLKDLEAKAEQERIEADRLKAQREQEERDRMAIEAEQNRVKAEQDAEMKKAADNAMTLFTQTAEVASTTAAPETRSAIVITVSHHAGWVELFTYWYQRENAKVSLEDMEKMTFEKLRKYAEKAAAKGDKIESKFITYGSAVTAVNRKVK